MTFKLRAIPNRAVLMAGLVGMSIAGFTALAAAQSSDSESAPSSSEPPTAMQELRAKQQEIQALMSELRQIQQQATEANPELAAEQEEYRDLVIDTMSDQNFDPEAEMENMRSLQAELQGGEQLGEEERQTMIQELEQKSQEFRSKQQQAMQSEEVTSARDELDEKMKAAMNEQNPEAEAMIAQLNELQQEYQSLLQEAMQQQQQQQSNAGSPDG